MIDRGPLDRAIESATTPVFAGAGDFDYIKDQYQKEHGAKGWTAALVKEMFGKSVSDKNAFPKNSDAWKDAKRKYDTDLRLVQRYAKGTINPERGSASIREKLAEVGRTLDPVRRDVPASGLTFVVEFNAPEDKGHVKRERTATVHMSSMEAFQFVNDPSYAAFFDLWADDLGQYYGEDGSYEVEVTGVTAG